MTEAGMAATTVSTTCRLTTLIKASTNGEVFRQKVFLTNASDVQYNVASMKPDWRECPRGDVKGQWAAFYVTMNPQGHVVMSRITYERLGEPKAFTLLFDKVNNQIGLKPTHAQDRNAYPVGPSGRYGGKLVRAYRLMQEFGISLPETIRFHNAEVDNDGILILDLRTARVSSRAKARRKETNKFSNGVPHAVLRLATQP